MVDLHTRSLVQLLVPLGWSVDIYEPHDPRLAAAALSADLVVAQMLREPELEAVIRLRRERSLATVYEITDNFLGIGDWLPPSHALRSPFARQSMLYHAHLADAVQVLVPGLAELFEGVNPRTIVFDPFVPFPERVPEKPPGFVFGWSATRTHAVSARGSAPAVVEFCRRHPEVTFAFMGDRSMFEEWFGAIAPAQTEVRGFGTREEHLHFVGGLHVGLAPMATTPFNATRADTRVCIYAGLGVAPVLEDAQVHRPHGGHAAIYRNAGELLAILEDLFRDRAKLADLADRARRWVITERGPEALGRQRDRAYRALLSGGPRPAPPAPEVSRADAAELAARLAQAYESAPERALEICAELVSVHPGYDQAHLIAARTLEDMGRHEEALEYAERVVPSPVYADLFAEMAARAARRVRPEAYDRHVGNVRSPFRRARLANGLSPAAHSRAVLEHQPYDHFALSSSIHRLRKRQRDPDEIDAMYERLCLVAPEAVPADRRPERLAPFLPS